MGRKVTNNVVLAYVTRTNRDGTRLSGYGQDFRSLGTGRTARPCGPPR